MNRSLLACASILFLLAGCARSSEQSAPAADSSADELSPPPQLAAVDASLLSGTWQWVGTNRPAGRIAPSDPAKYTLSFGADSTASVHADCNQGGGRYTLIEGQRIEFGPMTTTLMGCPEPSLGSEYLGQLAQAEAYDVSGDTMSLTLKLEAGTMRFVRGATEGR